MAPNNQDSEVPEWLRELWNTAVGLFIFIVIPLLIILLISELSDGPITETTPDGWSTDAPIGRTYGGDTY